MKLELDLPGGPLTLDDDPWRELGDGVDSASPLPRLCYAAAHVVMQPAYADVPHAAAHGRRGQRLQRLSAPGWIVLPCRGVCRLDSSGCQLRI